MLRVVLLVEDDKAVREMYRTALRAAGFFVQEASDGVQALRALDADPPDLVVLDLGLPLLSGYAVATDIAAQGLNIPIVVVTGKDAHGLGPVQCVLKKPVDPEHLVHTVKKCLAERAGAAGA